MDILREAGYEAYNVKADNYDVLEAELKTDFASMGLAPDGSYIIAISGERTNGNNPATRSSDVPSYEQDLEGAGVSFPYTHNSTTYMMRYVTTTSLSDPRLFVHSSYTFGDEGYIPEGWEELIAFGVTAVIDAKYKFPFASVATLLAEIGTDSNFTLLGPEELVIQAGTAWTHEYIQIWNPDTNVWHNAQRSSYATSAVNYSCYVYNNTSNAPEFFVGEEAQNTAYSPNFYNFSQRKADAVEAYLVGNKNHDDTGDIVFHFDGEDFSINDTDNILFIHYDPNHHSRPIIENEE